MADRGIELAVFADLPRRRVSRSNQFGYFLTSLNTANVPNPGGSQRTLCLSGNIGRHSFAVQNSGSSGVISIPLNPMLIPQPFGYVSASPGQTWYFQCRYRDFNPGMTSNFSNGVAVTIQWAPCLTGGTAPESA